MKEIWKNIESYEGLYQVSNFGRVRSLRFNKQRMLKPIINIYGYLVLNLCKDGNKKNLRIHQLVAMAFLDHKPNGMKIVVDHIDNNKKNNRADNLQLISQRQNSSKDKKGYSSKYVGVAWHKAKSKWLSKIWINGKSKHLGIFADEIEAAKAYQNALKSLS